MDLKTVVYKRRPKKKSVSDVPDAEAAEITSDNDATQIPRNAGSRSDDGAKPVSGGKTNDRKSWVDHSLSNRGRRSSLSFGEAYDLSTMAFKWIDSVGSRFIPDWGSKKKKKQGNSDRNGTVKKSSMANRSKRIEPPEDFVQEKLAMFAEIDAFELQSEEEKCTWSRQHEAYVDFPKELGPKNRQRKGGLEIVPEAGSEELSSESLSAALSAALQTPDSVCAHYSGRRDSVTSTGHIETLDFRLRHDLNRHDEFDQAREPSSNAVVRTEVVHGWNLDSEDEEDVKSRPRSSDSRRFSAESEPSERRLTAESNPNHRRFSAESRSSKGRHSVGSRSEKNQYSGDVDVLTSGLRSLQVDENFRLSTGEQLKSLVEDREDEEGCSESEEAEDSEESLRFGELLLGTDLLPIFEVLMKECHQTRPLSLREAISNFCDISDVVKLGEGTFGEAFKGDGCVFKIVPMDGEILVNGEVQKTSAEIYSEVLLTNTLTRLRGVETDASARLSNFCTNFIETKRIYICQGNYEQELVKAWEDWDAIRASDNDHPMIFPQKQLFVVFVLADGGIDLESFVLFSFSEARSILFQVVLALAVAEEACGFEHRDLHWGNIVLARDYKNEYGYYRLLDKDIRVKTFGVSVSIIDFTLSRIDTGKQVFFCNLSNDPELFEGPTRDVQSDTYRRMLNLTEGHWEGSFPKTNCFWIHYVTDILVNKKSFPASSQERRALRSFCKRVLLYDSANAASSDNFFHDLKIV
ncbi:hypothetical protein Mapa_015779 [Marchantia paleacea]|nr:hypothetical protein Mapa_015779 [Marchantia paleacea]